MKRDRRKNNGAWRPIPDKSLSRFPKLKRLTALLTLSIACFAPSSRAATLEEVEAWIEARWRAVQSISYSLTQESRTEAPNRSLHSTLRGTVQILRTGDLLKIRTEYSSALTQKVGDQETVTPSKILSISDGSHSFSLTETQGKITAVKTKAISADPGGRAYLGILKKNQILKVLPDEVLNGKEVFVIEGRQRGLPPERVKPTRYYFHKEYGLMVRSHSESTDGQSTSTMELTNLLINPPLGEDLFVFRPPEGVEVQGP